MGQFCIGMVGSRNISGWQDSPKRGQRGRRGGTVTEGKRSGGRRRKEVHLVVERCLRLSQGDAVGPR